MLPLTVNEPEADGLPAAVSWADVFAATDPSVQIRVVPEVVEQRGSDPAGSGVHPAGKATCTTTPVASFGPRLLY